MRMSTYLDYNPVKKQGIFATRRSERGGVVGCYDDERERLRNKEDDLFLNGIATAFLGEQDSVSGRASPRESF